MRMFHSHLWLWFCCAFLGVHGSGCKKQQPDAEIPKQRASRPHPPHPPHQRHKAHKGHDKHKDINQRFLDQKMDAGSWQKRFEDPKREVYQHRQLIAAQIGIRPGQDVADIGAGSGAYLETFLQRIGPTGTLYAVDISPNFVKFLQKRVQEKGYRNVKVVQNTATSTQLPAQSVDVAFICDTYHHFDKAKEMLTDLRKALRPKGRLVIVDFKRIPGVSSPWILNHVKHDQGYATKEITENGFVLEREVKLPQLQQNYMLIFRRQ